MMTSREKDLLVFWLRYREYMSARSEVLNFFARIQLDVSPS